MEPIKNRAAVQCWPPAITKQRSYKKTHTTRWALEWASVPGEVDGEVQGADDAVVPVGDGVLDVVGGGVHKHTAVVPGPRLHPEKRRKKLN